MGPPPNPPPLGPSVLTGTPPRVYPLQGTARRLADRSVFGSDTICNDPDLSLADISFRGSPQDFKTRLLGEGFHTLIKGDLFSSQPMWDITLPLRFNRVVSERKATIN